ncbi:MAG: FAD binding domain-containing protein [bacterium]
MARFKAIVPTDIDECLDFLDGFGAQASILAGGTDLMVNVRSGAKRIKYLVDISGLCELRSIEKGKGFFKIGALATHSEIAENLTDADCLCSAALSIGSPQIRNMGTLGGNLANASPAADLYPALMVLDAEVSLKSKKGERTVFICDLPKGPGSTIINPSELLIGVSFRVPDRFYSGYIKIGLRRSLSISVASAALLATYKSDRFDTVRIACGAVAPTPIRMRSVEALVSGKSFSDDLLRDASKLAESECDPISDIRATADYRRYVTGIIVSRLIEEAAKFGGLKK